MKNSLQNLEPQLVDRPQLHLVGLGAKFISVLSPKANNAQVIPALWHRYINRRGEILHPDGFADYGLVECLPKSERSDELEMFYIACAPVKKVEQIPAGMISRSIPPGRWAVFTHRGSLDTLGATMRFIHQEWMPQAKVQRREGPELEYYGPKFNPRSAESELEILLPLT
jgi:AraC family transcriptional regulator